MTVKVVFEDSKGKIRALDNMLVVDTMTRSLVRVSYTHHEIHTGCSFTTVYTDETLANGETIILVFKTMAGTKRVHMFAEFSTLVGGSLELWEDVTWTTNTGTANPIINRKRETTMASSGLLEDLTVTPTFTTTNNVLVNPTLSVVGATSLHKHYAWGERGKIGAGNDRDENEFILKPDTKYAAVFTGIGASNKAHVLLNWYEHKDSD